MATLIGKFPSNDSKSEEVHVFDDMTYRYEPNYTIQGYSNSHIKLDDDGVLYFRYERDDRWTRNEVDDWTKNVVKIIRDHISKEFESILLSKENE